MKHPFSKKLERTSLHLIPSTVGHPVHARQRPLVDFDPDTPSENVTKAGTSPTKLICMSSCEVHRRSQQGFASTSTRSWRFLYIETPLRFPLLYTVLPLCFAVVASLSISPTTLFQLLFSFQSLFDRPHLVPRVIYTQRFAHKHTIPQPDSCQPRISREITRASVPVTSRRHIIAYSTISWPTRRQRGARRHA